MANTAGQIEATVSLRYDCSTYVADMEWKAHPGYTAVSSKQNAHPHQRHPYQPVGDFLSNISRFQ